MLSGLGHGSQGRAPGSGLLCMYGDRWQSPKGDTGFPVWGWELWACCLSEWGLHYLHSLIWVTPRIQLLSPGVGEKYSVQYGLVSAGGAQFGLLHALLEPCVWSTYKSCVWSNCKLVTCLGLTTQKMGVITSVKGELSGQMTECMQSTMPWKVEYRPSHCGNSQQRRGR